jgi:copper chaperone CopZ
VIIRKLSELEGVGDVTVDLDGKRVTVDFESHKVCDSDITCAVEALGYKVHTV